MADREILARIDEHMARGNEHMARGNELMAEVVREHDETRQFMRDILRRHEIVLREMTLEMHESGAHLRTEMETGRRVLLDLHEESVAQRQAILSLIDELREHGLGGRN